MKLCEIFKGIQHEYLEVPGEVRSNLPGRHEVHLKIEGLTLFITMKTIGLNATTSIFLRNCIIQSG